MSTNPEKINVTPEHEHDAKALEQEGDKRREVLQAEREKTERSHEASVDDAREALEKIHEAKHEQEQKPLESERMSSPAERRKDGPLSRSEKDASFASTMQEVRTHMSPAGRTFSKVIHNKTVEKVSDAAASTIARPNALLAGAIFAFVLTLGVYLIAKNLGYPLSGFETIGAFILGWILGIIYDFLKVMITGRK